MQLGYLKKVSRSNYIRKRGGCIIFECINILMIQKNPILCAEDFFFFFFYCFREMYWYCVKVSNSGIMTALISILFGRRDLIKDKQKQVNKEGTEL